MRRTAFVIASLFAAACNDEAAEMLLTCQGGNFDACYTDGINAMGAARPDYGVARQSFSTACMSAHQPASCYQLGLLVRDAKGGPKDAARAYQLFDIACSPKAEGAPPGVPEACVEVGYALFTGDGAREDAAKAVAVLEASCGGDPMQARACALLGDAFATGKGFDKEKKDVARATDLYTKACEAQYAPGCVKLGELLIAEDRKGQTAAATAFKKACDLDARIGCYELAALHEGGKWDGASDALASEFYQKTCNIDPTRGCFEAAKLMEDGRVEASEGSIEYLYHQACEHGNTEACARRNVELDAKKKDKK